MGAKKQQLTFWQICEGDFARQAQEEFLNIQDLVRIHKKKLTLHMSITVFPNDQKKGYPSNFGEMSFQVIPPVVKRESELYVTELNREGMIIGDGKSIDDILQTSLEFEPDANVIPIQKESAND